MFDLKQVVESLRDEVGDDNDWAGLGVVGGGVVIFDRTAVPPATFVWGNPSPDRPTVSGRLTCPTCGRRVEVADTRVVRFCSANPKTGRTHSPAQMEN